MKIFHTLLKTLTYGIISSVGEGVPMAHAGLWTVVHGFSVPKNSRDPGVPDRISLYGVAYRASAGTFRNGDPV